MILPDRCSDRVARIDGPKQVHLHDKLQQRRIEPARLCVHGPTATAASICDQHIDPPPFLDDPRHHRLDRLTVTDINLDP
jgi:hypothetical protein